MNKELNVSEINKILMERGSGYLIHLNDDEIPVISDGRSQIVDFVLWPLKESVYKCIGQSKEAEVSIIACSAAKLLETLTLPVSKVTHDGEWRKKWGNKDVPQFHPNQLDAIKSVFNELTSYMISQVTYTYIGWTNDGKGFVFGERLVTATQCKEVVNISARANLEYGNCTSEKSCEFINKHVFELYKDRYYGITIVLYFILGLIKSRLMQDSQTVPSFMLSVIGETGSGKTSSIIPLVNPISEATSSFEATNKAIARQLKSCASGCVVIDDLNNETTEKMKKCEDIIRLVGDATTSPQIVTGNKVDNTKVRCMAVITAESLTKLRSSSIPRVLMLKLEKGMVDFKILTEIQNNTVYYISFVISLLQYMLQNDNFKRHFIENVKKTRMEAMVKCRESQLHMRYCDIYVWLTCTWQFIKDFFKENNIILSDDYENEVWTHLKKQHADHNFDPEAMFLQAFVELRDSNELHIASLEEFKKDSACDVVEESDRFFILSKRVFKKICKFYSESNIEFPCGERQLRRILYDRGLLEKPRGTHSNQLTIEKKTRSNKSKSGFYMFKHSMKSKLKEEKLYE